jgi:glycosyltransferase involved in cell wall biosynthesis
MAAPKILIVSDSLGTPIPGRGILNYTAGLLGAIRTTALSVTLLVERPKSYKLETDRPELEGISEKASHAIRVAAIHGFLSAGSVHYSFRGKNKLKRLALQVQRGLRKLWMATGIVSAGFSSPSKPEAVRNLGLVQSSGGHDHLDMVENFALAKRVYTEGMLRASYDLSPRIIDATEFEVILMDAPHFLSLKRAEKTPVVVVIHDLIPLFDLGPSGWRTVFAKKLLVSLRQATHLIFVSDATRSQFNEMFPNYAGLPWAIISPTIRRELIKASDMAARETRSMKSGQKPTFVSIVSDEPRKNIRFLIEAFTSLQDIADLVIMGRVDQKRYADPGTPLPANIRFAGYVSERAKIAQLRAADGMIFASTMEGFGIPIVEGALFGLPVFCSDLPVFRECTNGKAKYFDPFVPEELVTLVREFLEQPELGRSNVAALREYCLANYSHEAAAAKLKILLPIAAASASAEQGAAARLPG